MSIGINAANTKSVNWEQILSSIGDVQKTESVDGKESFTITTKGDEGTTITVSIPDDLEIPENVDKDTLQGLVDKLSNSGISFTDEQIAQMKDTISAYYDAMVDAINNVDPGSGAKTKVKNVMFNLYALMALMIDVAQTQRDAQREIRTSQNLNIQKSIQDQADQQRDAANLGMWVGIACGAFSAIGSLSVMAYQGATASQQANIVKQTGAEASSTHVSMLQNADSKVHSQTQLQSTINKVGDVVATEVTQNFQAQIANGGNGNLLNNFNEAVGNHNAAKADVQAKTANLTEQTELLTQRQAAQQIAESQFNAKTAVVDQKQQVVDQKQQAVDQKQQAYDNEVNRVVENETQEAKTARIDAAKAELDTAKVELNTAKNELDAAKAEQTTARTQFETANAALEQQTQKVTTAQNDLNLANQKVATTETAMNQARSDYQATIKETAAQYQEEYQSAVNRLANPQDGDDVAALKADVETAKAKMEMAFATEADLLAGEGVMTPTERNALMTATRAKADMAMDSAYRRMDVKALDQRMSKLMTIGNINQSIGGVLQTMASQLSSIKGSEATRQQAETTKQEEMLDQTKDLFSKAQDLVNQAIQLYTAVIQAENQSMRDAIQA